MGSYGAARRQGPVGGDYIINSYGAFSVHLSLMTMTSLLW